MRKTGKTVAIVAIAVLGLAVFSPALELGDEMPKVEVEMKNVDGEMLTLKEVAGKKGTLVIFSCRSCPFVQAFQDRMVEIGNEYRKKGVGVAFINSNDTEKYPQDNFENMQEQAKKNNYEFPYLLDDTSKVAKSFKASRTPEAFLFNPENELVYHGTIDDSPRKPKKVEKQYLRDALDAVLAGEEVPVTKTRSIGCGIKFRK